jgi:phage terminase large subunit
MGQIDIIVDPKVFNAAYLPYLNDDTRNQIFFGGSSSGKSVFVVGQRVVWDLLAGGRNYLILRNVARTSRQSTFNEVQKIIINWGVSDLFKINKSDMVITCSNGYQALFSGLDDVEKLKSITPQFGVITDIIIEEATEVTDQNKLKQLSKRLRGKSTKKKRLMMLFNPIMKTHWIFREFFLGRFNDDDTEYRDDYLLIRKTTYKDNAFLEPDDIYELENETDPYFHAVYTLGHWGTLGDIIFTNWHSEDLSGQIPHFDNIRNGLDFGYAKDPMAYNRTHFDRTRGIIYIFDERHEFELTNPEIAILLKPIVGDERVVCDSAEPKSIAELRNNGINAVGAEKGKDSISHGIQWLRQYQIIIHKECQETINEFQLYQYAKNKQGETLNKPIDRHNHHIDNLRYQFEDVMNMVETEIEGYGESVAQAGW